MIYCNTRNLSHHLTGVQRYTIEILKRFPESEWYPLTPKAKYARGVKGHLWEQFMLRKSLKKHDSLWSPSNTGPLFENQVLTVHDVVPFDHPEWLNKRFADWYRFIQPKLVKKVKKVVTISEFSKQRIMHHFDIQDDMIEVIYNGVDFEFFEPKKGLNESKRFESYDNYILALGSLEPRKNLARLLKAWSKVEHKLPSDFKLLVVGKQGSSLVFDNSISISNSDRVVFLGHVADEKLPTLYQNAKAFFYLSEYEGFGLPPLEAMAAGAPVVASDVTAIPEVVKDCGKLIDPFSIDEISNAILDALDEKISTKDIIEKGMKRAKSFTWDACAQKTWQVIQNI